MREWSKAAILEIIARVWRELYGSGVVKAKH